MSTHHALQTPDRHWHMQLQLTENCLVDLLVDWTLRCGGGPMAGHAVSRKVVLRFDLMFCFDRVFAACRQLFRSATATRTSRGSMLVAA